MEYLAIILIAAAVFGVCYLVDRGFTKHFRSQKQHRSGLSVRLNKRYGSMGLLIGVLGIAAVFTGIRDGWVLIAGGGVLIVTGVCLVAYYMSFGVFYDETGFISASFGRPDSSYTYKDIVAQQLYNNQGHILIELHLSDGKALHLQSTMTGAYAFLDYAFEKWCAQTGREKATCDFYAPENSCWFPPVEA